MIIFFQIILMLALIPIVIEVTDDESERSEKDRATVMFFGVFIIMKLLFTMYY